jgi:transcription termination factor Rho
MRVLELENTPLLDLRQKAKDLNIDNAARLKKEDLILRIKQVEAEQDGLELRGGILEIMNEELDF